ncbi:MAG: hypothetical protein HRS50_01225 [Mycoplasmataceae bacterium]|nr:hypothetical protein [Mycoplasmataceae bacterium]
MINFLLNLNAKITPIIENKDPIVAIVISTHPIHALLLFIEILPHQGV